MRRDLTGRKNDSTAKRRRSASDEIDRIRELETENALLRARVADLNRRIDEQSEASPPPALAAVEEEPIEALEAFLSEDDPHIDRVQRFLLG